MFSCFMLDNLDAVVYTVYIFLFSFIFTTAYLYLSIYYSCLTT